MKIVSLVPHVINVLLADGSTVSVSPSGSVARCKVDTDVVAQVSGISVHRTVFGAIEGLPEPKDGVIYLTSTLVAQAARRGDVVSPDTGPTAVRENGQVVAVRGFQTF